MLTAVLGTILPPMVILSVISFIYAEFAANPFVAGALKGMQAGVAAVIFDVVCDLGAKVFRLKKPSYLVVMGLAFAATWIFRVNVVLIILGAA